MLDQLLGAAKSQVIGAITEKTGMDAGQADSAFPLAQDSIKEGIMGAIGDGNISGIMGMLSGGGDLASNSLFNSISGGFITKLTNKLGIPESMASMVSSTALPMLINKVKGGVSNDDGEVSQEGIMAALGGGDGLMDAVKGKGMDMLKDKMGGLGGLLG